VQEDRILDNKNKKALSFILLFSCRMNSGIRLRVLGWKGLIVGHQNLFDLGW
jgi:hypothetical protein